MAIQGCNVDSNRVLLAGFFGFYDQLFACLGRLHPRDPYRLFRQQLRPPRSFGRHGSILQLSTGSSLDRDLLRFVEALEDSEEEGSASLVHQTAGFALLTTERALVYVRRRPTLQLEWYAHATEQHPTIILIYFVW